MNRRAVMIAVCGCAVLGGWLPSLWLPQAPEEKSRSLTELTLPPPPGPPRVDWQTAARQARSPLAAFQAVAVGVTERSRGILDSAAVGDPGFPEAEELARWLAADALGRSVKDSDAFLKSLRDAEDTDPEDREHCAVAMRAWAESNPDAALTALVRSDTLALGGAQDALHTIAAKNPDKALAALRAVNSGPWLNQAWYTVLQGCAKHGPDFALEAVQSAPQPAQSSALNAVLTELAGEDPRRALEWRETLPPELRTLTEIDTVFTAWADDDPAAAMQEWLARDGKIAGTTAGSYLTSRWAEKDPQAFFEWTLSTGKAHFESVQTALRAETKRDPQAALAMLRRLPPDAFDAEKFSDLCVIVGFDWSNTDPAAALAWARSLPEEQRREALSGMIHNLPSEDRLALSAELGTATPDGFQALLSADTDGALHAFAEMPAAARVTVYDKLVARLNDNGDYARAARVLASLTESASEVPIAEGITEALATQTVRWTGTDPGAAAEWVSQLPSGAAQATAAANVACTWGRYDLPAARAWVEQLPPGEAHDKAAAQISRLTKLSGD